MEFWKIFRKLVKTYEFAIEKYKKNEFMPAGIKTTNEGEPHGFRRQHVVQCDWWTNQEEARVRSFNISDFIFALVRGRTINVEDTRVDQNDVLLGLKNLENWRFTWDSNA